MLNRRNLRIKAMQTLFAYYQGRKSNQEIAWMDLLAGVTAAQDEDLEEEAEEVPEIEPTMELAPGEEEQPKLDPEPITEPERLSEAELTARELLKKALSTQLIPTTAPLPKGTTLEEANLIDEVCQVYQQQTDKDLRHLRKSMLQEVEGVHQLYLWVLALPLALTEMEALVVNKKQLSTTKPLPRYLVENQGLKLLEQRLQGVDLPSWSKYNDRLAQWYKELRQQEAMVKALEAKEAGLEGDVKLLRFIFKSIVWKSQSFQDFFEEYDMGWSENKDIIKSLVNKTLKSISEEGVELAPLSYQWDDDKQFFEDIFDYTVQQEEWAANMIAEQAKNWDMERIAQLDMVLLKMALSEMIKFPSIPVKVTINEYIEISKKYSTPKSKKFINGILDVLASDLTANGTIKKSGRGLIDNK